MPCPNGCKLYVKRKDLKFHNGECPCVQVSCPYRVFGCGDRFLRGIKEQKMKDDAYIHLALLAKHQSELTKRFIEIEKKIDEILDQDNRKNEANTNRDRIIHKKKINKKTSTPMSFSNNKVSESIEEIEDDDEIKSSKNDNSKDINDDHKVNGDLNSDNNDIEMNSNKDNKDNNYQKILKIYSMLKGIK